jgi:class 3 adenylate cyclase
VGSKFCNECTAPLAATGQSLKTKTSVQIPYGIQIKPEQIDSSSTPDGERKTVTALFADIKGSMELMEDLDPEEARAIIDPALKLMIDAVHRYGGYIVQSTGDGIFALFGARWLTRTIRKEQSMRHCECRKRCGATVSACWRRDKLRSR